VPAHVPFVHLSPVVHLSPSSQVVPLAFCTGVGQTPVAVLHAPAVWHWSAVHTTGLLPVHTPALQVSVWVQAFPSLQVVPSVFGLHAVVLVPGVHCWHWLAGFVASLA